MKNSKKILLVISIIILIILGCIMIYYANLKKQANIIRFISKAQREFYDKDNYYEKITINSLETSNIIEKYTKGEKYINFETVINNKTNEKAKKISIGNKEGIQDYYEIGKENLLENTSSLISPQPVNFTYNDNSTDKEIIDGIKFSKISIKNKVYNNNECYVIKFNSEINLPESYFDISTGLLIKYSEAEYEYKFNCVEDSIFEPDLTNYVLYR